ncbi:Uncharacterised protein [uncultured archaeon]|nr:Uncharacterised protein [uncultured archaeon]
MLKSSFPSRMLCRQTLVTIVFVATMLLAPALGADASYAQKIILNVYLDNTGKALVTGYAENVSGLAFLNSSQYRLENDTHQLYALTDGLTTKVGDLWTLRLNSSGSFDDYRITFFLPSDMRLGKINTSKGLGYLLSASNESMVADVQGYEVVDPRISIQYQQPLEAGLGTTAVPPPGFPGSAPPGLLPIIAGSYINLNWLLTAVSLLIAIAVLAFFVWHKRIAPFKSGPPAAEISISGSQETAPTSAAEGPEHDKAANPSSGPNTAPIGAPSSPEALFTGPADDGVYLAESQEGIPSQEDLAQKPPESLQEGLSSAREPLDMRSEAMLTPTESHESGSEEDLPEVGSVKEGFGTGAAQKNEIAVSSEMEAVMQTLTARENAVMKTLIDHGGRMTQADIRYETGTPKSSLTGILISLERRKLITKKEWGRTNIIELSEWFLSKKERS